MRQSGGSVTRTPGRTHSFSVEGVAKNFRSDWQFLIAASRMSSALSLATLFSVIAIVTKFADLVNLGTYALACFIAAVVCYAVAIVIIKVRAPQIIQEYPDFKSYDDKKHSHRWVLWQFYHAIQSLEHGFKLLEETVAKRLSTDVATMSRSRLPLTAAFRGNCLGKSVEIKQRDGSTPIYDFCVYEPLNFDRDLIMGFTMKSSADGIERKYVLPVRESDVKLDWKVKELFWIVLTEAAKENPVSRWVAWSLVRLAGALLFLAVGLAVSHVLLNPKPQTPSLFQNA
jgi:hypothetical protein